MAEIVLDHVSKRFSDGYEAVKDMSLEIADGEFVILVGPSGCGKSTALRMIAGLEDITDGEMRIGGDVVNEYAPKDRDIAMVFQNYALYPHMTVRENMAFPLKLAKVAQATRSTRKVERGGEDPRPRAAPRPQAGQPLRRPAPARRDGAGDRARPEGVPDGRAAVEPRRQAARADAHRGLAHPAAARHDDRLRHPRPDRGDDARRPRRGDARRACCSRSGRPSELYDDPANLFVAGLHRLAGDELHAGARSRATRSSCRSATCRLAGARERSALGAAGRERDRRASGPRTSRTPRWSATRATRASTSARRSTWSSRWARSCTPTSRSSPRASSPRSSPSSPRTPARARCRAAASGQVVARLDAASEVKRGRGGGAVGGRHASSTSSTRRAARA